MVRNTHEVNRAFRFWVELDSMQVSGFSEVSGLQSETEFEEYREGGLNGYVHRFPKSIKFPPIVLKRGMTVSKELWSWYESVMNGKIIRKNGSIIMNDEAGVELCRWNFFDAYPSKWIGPELNAMNSNVAIESVELVHNGLKAMFKS